MKNTFVRFSLYSLLLIGIGYVAGCRPGTNDPVLIPKQLIDGLNTEGAKLLYSQTRKACEGVYQVSDGASVFGDQIVAKWSYLVKGPGDTTHYMSLFCEPQAAFFVMEGRQVGDSLVFEGFWRRLVNADVGTARFVVVKADGANALLAPDCCASITKGGVIFRGRFGDGNETRNKTLTLTYDRPLNKKPFQILAHRGGGRTSDLLPASENSTLR